ncbi:hypothetical protein KGP36_07860, partial [Patescibacteria group bacterium]|nr:hypothetical protein [Patescibacteria group bacterium]
MVNLFQDFETRSLIDLKQRGLPVYSSHPSTEVLLLSYAFDRGPVELWEPHVGPPPQKLVNALKDPTVRKVAWNAAFEHDIWAKVLGVPTSYSEWFDVKVEASYLSLAGGLGDVCQILEMPENDAKIKEGDSLITLFSSPYRRVGEATIFGVAEPSFHDWSTRPAEWQRFREYCARDTEVERKLFYMFEPVAMEYLQSDKGWVLDRKINDAGVPVNLTRLQKALRMVEGSSDNPTFGSKEYLMKEFRGLTGLENPNSRDQLLPWLQKNGYPFMSLNKVLVRRALIMGIPQACKDALVLRLEAAKTSYSKFKAIADRVSEDGRQRDMFVYMGAARTGRWSGYGVQFQNLPRPLKAVEKNLDRALDLIDKEDAKTLVEEFVQPNEYTQKRT